jgi:cell shape-determining protein MreD
MAQTARLGYFFKIFGEVLAVILFSLVQASFLAALPRPFDYFNLVLSLLIFLTIIINFRQALWFAIIAGFILDSFSLSSFGALTVTMLITAVILNALFKNFFTNRSFYSLLILGLMGNVIYDLLLLIFNFVFFIFGIQNNLENFLGINNISGLGWQIIFNFCFLAIMFWSFNFLSKRMKSVFIDVS